MQTVHELRFQKLPSIAIVAVWCYIAFFRLFFFILATGLISQFMVMKSLAKLIQEKAPMWKGEEGWKRKRRPTSPKKETRSASLQTRTPKEKNDSIDSYFFVFASAGFDPEDMQVGMRIMHYKTRILYVWGYWYVVWCVYHPESWHKFMIWLPKPTLKH